MKLQTLLCPICGGPLPPARANDTVTCTFCGETSLIAPDSASAAEGTRVARTAAEATDALCPRCALTLFEGRAHEVRLLGCGQCGGIWLDNASAQAAVKQKDDAVMTLVRRASQRASIPTETRESIDCPSCKTTMGRVQRAGVTIDVCIMHGTWFDRNELGVVLGELRRPAMRPMAPLIDDRPLLASEIPDFKQGAGLDGTEGALVAGGILTAVLGLAALAGDR